MAPCDEGGHICMACGTKIKNKNNIQRHILLKHIQSDERYLCPCCHKVFSPRVRFQAHVHRSHKSLKGLDVEQCVVSRNKKNDKKEKVEVIVAVDPLAAP